MPQISNAILGVTIVLSVVFIPLAFMTGSVGVIYKQFSIAMAISIVFSGFLALSLTPALCATLLKPIHQAHVKKGFWVCSISFLKNLAGLRKEALKLACA